MCYPDKISRLSRLTSILLKLQARPYVSVKDLSKEFQVSTRTIYRDFISLEQAGVPIVSEGTNGFSLIDGFNIPPVMFTEAEANALIIAEKIIAKTKDDSLISAFSKATDKIKSVLKNPEMQKANFLSERTIIGKNWDNTTTSSFLSEIQKSLTNLDLLHIEYRKEQGSTKTKRTIEPFAIYHNTSENWVVIAWCRLRNEFRNFRVDRILTLRKLDKKFTPHKISLDEYVEIQRKKHFNKSLT
ncbi:MAG: helix-turn-helix transcriptional regulator [Cyclobacteriaceae bacterium]